MNVSPVMILPFDIRTYWLHSSGEGGGADYDLVMERDPHGLPTLRGKHVAGLLRLALDRAADWGWFEDIPQYSSADIPMILMGDRSDGAPGCLDVRSAVVVDPLRAELLVDSALRAACFQRLATTAVESIRGVARDGHLRSIEAAIPLALQARVRFAAADRLAWSGNDQALRRLIEVAEMLR